MGSVLKEDNEESLLSIDLSIVQQSVMNLCTKVNHAYEYYYRLNPIFIKICIFFYGISFFLLFPVICYNFPYSMYWMGWDNNDIVKQVSSNNHERFVAANNYIRSKEPFKLIPNPAFTVSVITVKRTIGSRPLGYLTQVMAKLDQIILSDNPLMPIQLLICDVHAGPGPHTEAESLQNTFERKQRFHEPDAAAVIMDSFEKEKQDYLFCLQQSLERNPKYVLLLEDDAVPRIEMLNVIHSLLTLLEEHQQKWSLLKLYYPEKWQGYAFEITKIIELLCIGILSGFAFYTFHYCSSKHPVSRTSKNLKCISFLIGFCYGVLSCLAIGRVHLLELKRMSQYTYSLKPGPDCCSPGILYPADSALQLISMLNRTVCHHNHPLDMALAKSTQTMGYKTYIIEPNLIQHIGMVSTLKGISKSPWDFLL